MKILLKVLLISIPFFIISCVNDDKVDISETLSQSEFIKENVAVNDARYRSVSNQFYVKEIVLINFSKDKSKNQMPETLTSNGTSFFDDGSYNDITANDGIYTSAAKFYHDESRPFVKDGTINSVMFESYIIDTSFKHSDKLSSLNSKKSIGIECDIEFGTCGCNADDWGWCDCCCFSLSNCKASLSIL
ncbi:MAG: hypothetical protein ABFR62_07470 [Bacteroidota bacterium]